MFKSISGLQRLFRVSNPLYHKLRIFVKQEVHVTVIPRPRLFSNISGFDSTFDEQNTDIEEKQKILLLEIDVMRQKGIKAPDPALMKHNEWDYLLSLPSSSARRKYYVYLWQLQMTKLNSKTKKMEKSIKIKEKREVWLEEYKNEEHLSYGLFLNSMFLRVYDTAINFWDNKRLVNAMLFGQNLVFDCSYDPNMVFREANNTAKQLMISFSENRVHKDPFNLHFCNANSEGHTYKVLKKIIPTIEEPWFPLNVTEKSYLDIFPKNKLVYLTPHCPYDLEEYNPDDIYIIGAIVDKVNNEPLSLAKAKKEGLRMARLPLDRYLQWNAGSGKSLTLNQMLLILLELKLSGDWKRALQIVPRRKISDPYQDHKRNMSNNYFDKEKRKMNQLKIRNPNGGYSDTFNNSW